MTSTVFIYVREKEIKVLEIDDSKAWHKHLIDTGFKHTATVNASVLIKHLLTESDDVSETLSGLIK